MSDPVQIELIRAIPNCVGTIGAVAAAWFSYKASTHSKDAMDTARRTETLTAQSSSRHVDPIMGGDDPARE